MPFVNDYSEDEEKGDALTAGSSASAGGFAGSGGARQAAPSKQQESNFVPWGRFVSANSQIANRSADKLRQGAQGQVDSANSQRDAASKGFNDKLQTNYTQWRAPSNTAASAGTRAAPAPGLSLGAGFGAPQQKPKDAVQNATLSSAFGGVTDAARDKGPQGSPDLHTAVGEEAWSKLSGAADKAQADATALGSESGVQAALQREGTPASALGAALVNQAGADGFRQTAKDAADLSGKLTAADKTAQSSWGTLLGDVDTARFDKKATDEANAFNYRATPTAIAPGFRPGPAAIAPTWGGVTETKGANGVFDDVNLTSDFDPTTDKRYQDALAGLQKSVPLPSFAATPKGFLEWVAADPQHKNFWDGWTKTLGVTGDELTAMLKGMPQWQWEMFARGIIPASLNRGIRTGHFSGFTPVKVTANGAGTDPEAKPYLEAYYAVIQAIMSAG